MHRAVDYAYNREKGGERMKIAIVTGASSGLGMAFVRRLDALGGLDEIWGVARRGSGWRRWRRSCAPRCGRWPWI